jgi:hypothetical protein
MRGAAPNTLRGRVIFRLAGGMFARGLRAAQAALVEQIAAEMERRGRVASAEPDLPEARRNGILAAGASDA